MEHFDREHKTGLMLQELRAALTLASKMFWSTKNFEVQYYFLNMYEMYACAMYSKWLSFTQNLNKRNKRRLKEQ